MKEKVSIPLSVVAILISLGGFFVSLRACKISEQNFELQLEPLFHAEFVINNDSKKYDLRIFNDGPITIHDLKIKTSKRVFDFKKKETMVEISDGKRDWQYIKEFKPKDSLVFPITADAYDVFTLRNEIRKSDEPAVLVFSFTFRRYPDRKIYRSSKYLFLYKDRVTSKPIAIDPDEIPFREERQRKRLLESYETK